MTTGPVRAWLTPSAAIGILAAMAVVGCSSQPTTEPPRAAATQDVGSVVFRSSRAYEADGRALFLARQELIRRCLVKRGFAYSASTQLPEPAGSSMPSRRDGYGLHRRFARLSAAAPTVLRSAREPSTHPQARYLRRLSSRERAAYDQAMDGSAGETVSVQRPGIPAFSYRAGGCHTRALEKLHGSLREHYSLLAEQNAVGEQLGRRLARDAGLLRSAAAWRRCMAARGFRHRSSREARDDVYAAYVTRRNPAGARSRELVTASADRACGQASRVYEEQARAQQAALRSVSGKDRRTMLRLGRLRAAAAERARVIIASAR